MKTIRLLLEYGAYPVWIYDEDNCVIDTALPEEWENDVELDNALTEIQSIYDSLFINNEKEFLFAGFKSEKERENFDRKVEIAVAMLYEKNNGLYQITNDIEFL